MQLRMECTYSTEYFLAGSAVVTVCMQLTFFVIAAYFAFDKVTDFAGGSNFVLIAVLGLVLQHTFMWRQIAITACVVLWGSRLSAYLLLRVLKTGKDDRFDSMNRGFTLEFAGFWLAQALWVWVVSLPVTLVNASCNDPPASALDYIGIFMFATGLIIEAIADQQKFHFKNLETSKGKFVSSGLWSWSRHPNYFGEMLVWWGIFTACATTLVGGWGGRMLLLAVASPVFLTLLLLFASGIPILEASADKRYGGQEEYRKYKAGTSVLLPIPPSVYASIPAMFKTSVLCEWPIYSPSAGGASAADGPYDRID